jgi:Glycogen recognition site of AMP-activated protein kinase
MDRISELRAAAKQQYRTLRQSLDALEERVVAQHWTEDRVVRSGFGQVRGSLDRIAGWLLAEDKPREVTDGPRQLTEGPRQLTDRPADEPGSMADEPGPTADEPGPTADAGDAADVATADRVDVTFCFPADIDAGSVALCGEFNEWSVDALLLERGPDGVWRTTVALEPGRSYRYRYLLDGERWENDQGADHYAPNPYGSTDSVIIVGP